MYDNIGGKIKSLAKVLFIIGAIGYVITGIVLMASSEYLIVYGLLVMVLGPVAAWISSWLLYGFGHLIENSDKLIESASVTNSTQIRSRPDQNKKEPTPGKLSVITGNCELCGKTNVPVCDAVIVDDLGTRYRRICSDCFNKNNAAPAK